MAKKRSKRQQGDGGPVRFDDRKYGNVRASLTYDYDELAHARAATYLGSTVLAYVPLAVSLLCLVGIVVLLMASSDNMIPAILLVVLSIVASMASNRWGALQLWYARRTTLAYESGHERRIHVAVGDSQVFVEDSEGKQDSYDLSDLRTVRYDTEGLLAGFGQWRYIYFPRSAMSEGRYNALVRILKEEGR